MFKGLSQLGDMAKLLRQAQEMQQKMAEAQARLDAMEVEGSAGGGLVRARVSAKGTVRAVSVDPALLRPEDREVVEDLIVAALRDAQERAAEAAAAEMQKAAEGLPLPPGMKLPFG